MNSISEHAIDTAKAVLAKCAANDPWFPQPAQYTLLAWAEQFANCNLDREDLLAGVTAVYRDNGSGFKPLPADILKAARALRRDRSEREDRREQHSTKAAAAETESLAAAFVSGPVRNKTPRLIAAEDALQCAVDKHTAQAAIREFFAAKTEARAQEGAA